MILILLKVAAVWLLLAFLFVWGWSVIMRGTHGREDEP